MCEFLTFLEVNGKIIYNRNFYYEADEYKNAVCKLVLKNKPSKADLYCIVEYGTEKYREKARILLDNLE